VGDEPNRSDLRLIGQAVHQDWPVSPENQAKILDWATRLFDRQDLKERTGVSAMLAIAALANLALKQQALDLAREKFEGRQSEVNLADLVAEAEQRAEERERTADGAAGEVPQ
jgi:hypothetical protein